MAVVFSCMNIKFSGDIIKTQQDSNAFECFPNRPIGILLSIMCRCTRMTFSTWSAFLRLVWKIMLFSFNPTVYNRHTHILETDLCLRDLWSQPCGLEPSGPAPWASLPSFPSLSGPSSSPPWHQLCQPQTYPTPPGKRHRGRERQREGEGERQKGEERQTDRETQTHRETQKVRQ